MKIRISTKSFGRLTVDDSEVGSVGPLTRHLKYGRKMLKISTAEVIQHFRKRFIAQINVLIKAQTQQSISKLETQYFNMNMCVDSLGT